MPPVTHNTIQVKKMNVELIKNALKVQGVSTKASIANLTKLSVATCGSILNDLVAAGEAIELEPDEPNGGRPAKKYKYNVDFGCAICLLVKTEGGNHSICYRVVNLVGETLQEAELQLQHIDVEAVDSLIGRLLSEHAHAIAIGIGIPGVVRRGIIGVCDVPDLAGQPLGPYIEDKYEVTTVLENDMNMTVYGFYHLQNFEEEKTFAVVTFPKNHFPGAGLIVDGRILTGNTKFGGEVSFLPLGMTREEQLDQLLTEEGFVRIAVRILTSIIAILNPIAIVLTGELPRGVQLEDLVAGCLKDIPTEHMPELHIQKDTHQEYMQGMAASTLESLTYRLQITERR
ncbi:putative NBD/HSP70 family sugar kinase [Paenibacillus phyllosphaerae]|uniref:Putative NBD/HSP70 family sugar kinase n=1 Tax=Paenibacillus phyllosphaerae TaxID=274593 RepID=A0A7W5FR57_9BACL|nr:ROK family protein [Paenibacillus phyllosphaerae]MBB3114175.1 putative NBD/HSP70 family sugar kinase [Paenibacillus phyllosphaerae]